ncbi:MAG: hypothetical protein ACLR56_11295 [Oscillospiraceae bacterium]
MLTEPIAPAFYNSREIKEIGTVFVKIKGARSVGVLLTPQDILVVYNMKRFNEMGLQIRNAHKGAYENRAVQRTAALLFW